MDNRQVLEQAIEYAKIHKSFNKYTLVQNAQNVCVFGLGRYFKECFCERVKENYHINLLSDNNPDLWGTEIDGLKVVSPAELEEIDDLVVIIMVGKSSEVQQQLESMGIVCVSHVDLSIDENLGFEQNQEKIEKEIPDIIQALDLYEDEESKRIYAHAIAKRISQGISDLTWKDLYSGGEYFGQDFMPIGDNEVYVDCGAYNGDTVLEFVEHVNDYEAVYAFELDHENYGELVSRTNRLPNVICEEKGVYSEAKKIAYSIGEGEFDPREGISIMKASEHATHIQYSEVVTLDGYFGDRKVTFIKMDIEGCEEEALKGAGELITKQAPKLAICVYHRTDDFWKLPQLIKKYHPSYKLYLRHHNVDNCWGSVLYAI